MLYFGHFFALFWCHFIITIDDNHSANYCHPIFKSSLYISEISMMNAMYQFVYDYCKYMYFYAFMSCMYMYMNAFVFLLISTLRTSRDIQIDTIHFQFYSIYTKLFVKHIYDCISYFQSLHRCFLNFSTTMILRMNRFSVKKSVIHVLIQLDCAFIDLCACGLVCTPHSHPDSHLLFRPRLLIYLHMNG